MIKIAVVDDDPLVLDGLTTILGAVADLDVIGTGTDGVAAIGLVERHGADLDVLLLDVRMPRMGGLEAARRIVGNPSAPAVVMMTTFDDDAYLAEALRLGASGFVLKRSGAAELANAVRIVAGGHSVLFPERVRDLLSAPRSPHSAPALTPTELRVLEALVRGDENREIAEALHVTRETVKTHVSSILAKFGARNRTHAAVMALDTGLVT